MHGSLEPNKLSKLCDKPTEMMVTKYSLSFYVKDVGSKIWLSIGSAQKQLIDWIAVLIIQ